MFTCAQGNEILLMLVYMDDLLFTRFSSELIIKTLQTLGLFICYRNYTFDLLAEISMLGLKPIRHPDNIKHKMSCILKYPSTYKRHNDKLIYLTIIQFMQAPTEQHLEAT
uniref:Reverse transcriptase Ty1/copia-type domain-containing protein n=1 Tax=Kalanchoe fedtschenkoi TaxID=63787 RepID=A0A7N0U4I8_KALFE